MTYVKTILIVLTLTVSAIFNFTGKPSEENTIPWKGKKIVIAMDTNHYNYFVQKGFPMGYQMELLNQFAADSQLDFEIRLGIDSTRFEMLENGEIDMFVFSEGLDSLHKLISTQDQLLSSIPLDEHVKSVWLGKADHKDLIYAVNSWICNFKGSKLYSFLQVKYFERSYVKSSGRISQYDHLLKKYSSQIEWDWRLLAALVYHESMFQADVRSKHGASGLMQLMPVTAELFGVDADSIHNPEDNIKAGVKLLAFLKKQVRQEGIPEEEQVKFILASYNAGCGRIEDCRAVARQQGLNPNLWQDVRSVIPMMKNPSAEIAQHMLRGKFNGNETFTFVETILATYQHYLHFFGVEQQNN